jgi:hypothetical protein
MDHPSLAVRAYGGGCGAVGKCRRHFITFVAMSSEGDVLSTRWLTLDRPGRAKETESAACSPLGKPSERVNHIRRRTTLELTTS